jgi:hypothetical protein
VAAAAAAFARSRGIDLAGIAPALSAFGLLLIPYLGLGQPALMEAVGSVCRRRGGGLIVAGAIVAPAAAALPWEDAGRSGRSALLLALYALAPLVVLDRARRSPRSAGLLDALALLLYWLPMELGMFRGFWERPGVDPTFLLMKLVALSLLLAGFGGVRGLEGIGYRWRLGGGDLVVGSAALAAFLAISIPAAIATGFVTWAPRLLSFPEMIYKALGVGLFIALPEEILFRGVMFNLMQRSAPLRHGPWPALVAASIVFGIAHLNNPPLMDVRYVLLATIAGVAYGWCYLRTGSLMPGIFAHTAVDLVHHLLLRSPGAP